MKLGIFDSGLGGLLITRAVRAHMPDIDILYYGDTLHLPYGNRSEEAIYEYTRRAVDFMFQSGCALVVIACNTASASALRRLQQTWLKTAWPGRNILGVVVPTLEAAADKGYGRIGLIGTHYSVRSGVYVEELKKINPDIQIMQRAAPLLVPMIENDGIRWIAPVVAAYLSPIWDFGADCLILGCTHYPIIEDQIRAFMGPEIDILSQDRIIPEKLKDYLMRHPEYNNLIGRSGQSEFMVSDLTDNYVVAARALYGADIKIEKAIAA